MSEATPATGLLAAWGRFVHRRRWAVLVLSLLLVTGSLAVVEAGGQLSSSLQPQGDARRAADLLRRELPATGHASFQVVFVGHSLRVADPAFRSAMLDALAPLRHEDRVASVRTPYDGPSGAPDLVSADGHAALAVVELRDDFAAATAYYPRLRSEVRSRTLRVLAAGDLAVSHDLDLALDADLEHSQLFALPLSLLLLLLVFGTVVAAVVPLGTGVFAILGGTAAVLLANRATSVSDFSVNIVALLGLGLAIDYSLFIVSRFREELDGGRTTPEALAAALATAGLAITFSGLTVAISLCGLFFYQGTFIASLGLTSLAVLLAVLYGLTFLPAVLAILGPNVNRLRVHRLRPGFDRGFWAALAGASMRRPLLALGPVLVLLAVVGSPFLQLRFESNDLNFLPRATEARQAHDVLAAGFPDQVLAQVPVVVSYPDGHPLTPSRVGQLYDLSRSIVSRPGVRGVRSLVDLDPSLSRADYQALYAQPALPDPARAAVQDSVGTHVVVLTVIGQDGAGSDRARALVRSLRSLTVPGARVMVTGETAFDVDMIDLVRARTPAAIAFVVAVTYLVLFVLLRSVVLPLKAVILSLLSITASFGAMVWIFQQGHLRAQLGFTPAGIDPALPVVLFCIVFGLSMDYEVLLLTRIREAYAAGRDDREAVTAGLQRSGPLITGAAAIMVVVFGSFATGQVVLFQAIGIGLALAVAIDATLVRMVLVPALMRLLGALNWWAPRLLGGAGQKPRTVSADPRTRSAG